MVLTRFAATTKPSKAFWSGGAFSTDFSPLVNVWKKVFTECDSVTVSQHFGFGSRISLRNSLLSPAFAVQVTDLSVVPTQLFVKQCDDLDKLHNSG